MKAKFTYHDRLEIRFDSVPTTRQRAELKAHGFWWDNANTCWWLARPVSVRYEPGKATPIVQDGFEYAIAFLKDQHSATNADLTALRLAHNDAGHRAGAQGMEEACGIA